MNNYPKIVQQIHNDFDTASEVLLEEVKEILAKNTLNVDKINRLKLLGFSNTKEVTEAEQAIKDLEASKKLGDIVMEYKKVYPLHKFITIDQVNTICNKYNLVCGSTNNFIGFVPEKNLKEIENFKKSVIIHEKYEHIEFKISRVSLYNDDDKPKVEKFLRDCNATISGEQLGITRISPYSSSYVFESYIREKAKLKNSINSLDYEKIENNLSICAPEKDFKFNNKVKKGNFLTEMFKAEVVKIEDPVVLQRVKYGYLIVSAWGDESKDPIVMNPINN